LGQRQDVAEHPALTNEGMSPAEGPTDSIPWVNSLFEQPWWLDAVAPGRWGAVVVRQGGEMAARLPYVRRKRLGLTTIVQPPLTQTLGPWLGPISGKYARRLEVQKKHLGELIDMLPPFDYFRMSFSPALTNWLPFYWAGFQATVRYTYRLEDLSDLDRVRSDFQEHVRRGIRKAASSVEVDHEYPLEDLLRLDARTYARQGMRAPYPPELVRRIDAACAARGARRILGAVDSQGRTHAALLVAWDDQTLYPLVNARDPELQTFGSNTILYWEAIRLASEVSRVFDFEGSMIEPIEHFVRGFGGRQTPYLSISKAGIKARTVLAAMAARQAMRDRRAPRPNTDDGRPAPG
jgi:Acetyltransferase (GNAT) domain